MKRYILPVLLVVVGAGLLVPYWIMSDDPSSHPTGERICRRSDSGLDCSQGNYNQLTFNIAKISLVVGVVAVPSGMAIGIYRLVQMKRTKLSKK